MGQLVFANQSQGHNVFPEFTQKSHKTYIQMKVFQFYKYFIFITSQTETSSDLYFLSSFGCIDMNRQDCEVIRKNVNYAAHAKTPN